MKGPSLKNKAFKKRSLTKPEQQAVKKTMAELKARWATLLERNQWKPTE